MKYEDESDNDESDKFEEKEIDAFEGKVTILRKMITLRMKSRMRVLMMDMLMSQRSFIKHSVVDRW